MLVRTTIFERITAKATDPDVIACACCERRLHSMRDIIGSFSRSLFVVVAVVYNHIKFEKSQTRLVSHSKTHSKAFFVPREVVVMW